MKNGKENIILLVNTANEDMTDVITFNPKEYNVGKDFTIEGDGFFEVLESGHIRCTVSKESYLCIRWNEE